LFRLPFPTNQCHICEESPPLSQLQFAGRTRCLDIFHCSPQKHSALNAKSLPLQFLQRVTELYLDSELKKLNLIFNTVLSTVSNSSILLSNACYYVNLEQPQDGANTQKPSLTKNPSSALPKLGRLTITITFYISSLHKKAVQNCFSTKI